ncbi:MAG: hypothetical protein ACREDH_15610 [Methylocella sp.]
MMPEPKPRAPFKSGVTDYDALHKRLRELGIDPYGGAKNGVDITPKPQPPKPEIGHYTYY